MGAYIINVPDTVDTIIYVNIGDVYDGKTYIASQRVEDLTPYTEPDIERVRKEAYENGYENGFVAGHLKAEKSGQSFYEDGYQKGLSDAWEAARTLWNTPNRKEIFGHTTFNTVLTTLTAQETIEKIRQYEQEKGEIKVGDEVEGDEDGQRGVVIDSRFENSQVAVLTGNSKVYSWWSKCAIHKTGRHFPEIATVLEKMREDAT